MIGPGALAILSAAALQPAPTVVIEHTYLKARPGKVEPLAAYIEANWFAMDAEGVRQGLFTSYRLLRPATPSPEWDLIVAVGYPQARGFDEPGVAKRFGAIRARHREVRIDGATLVDLGAVVRSERLFLGAGRG